MPKFHNSHDATISAVEQAQADLEQIFVLIVERNENGNQRILDWGLHSIGEVVAWITVGKDNHQEKGDQK